MSNVSNLELTATFCVKLLLSLSLLSNPDLKLICFILLSAKNSTHLFRQRLCSCLMALWRFLNFVLLLLLLLLFKCVKHCLCQVVLYPHCVFTLLLYSGRVCPEHNIILNYYKRSPSPLRPPCRNKLNTCRVVWCRAKWNLGFMCMLLCC